MASCTEIESLLSQLVADVNGLKARNTDECCIRLEGEVRALKGQLADVYRQLAQKLTKLTCKQVLTKVVYKFKLNRNNLYTTLWQS